MKRRELKKSVNYLCGELLAECFARVQFDNVPEANARAVMESILIMQADIVSRISHVQPGNTRMFFKKLRQDLTDRCEEIIADINTLV